MSVPPKVTPVVAVPAMVISPKPKTVMPLLKLILTVPVSVLLSPIVAPPAEKVPAVLVKPAVKIILAGVVTDVDTHLPVELCVTNPVKVEMPALLLSVKSPAPIIEVVPVTVKLPVVFTNKVPVSVRLPGIK